MNNKTAAGELLAAVRGVSVRAGDRSILDRVDLAVHAGRIVTLIGPNGAGKTTLVRLLLGLMPVASGEVFRRARLRIGYMPQRLVIDEGLPLTVRRFLTLNNGVNAARVREALHETGAASLIDEPVQVVSGGELQRVMLARALLRDPQLLVLDEPAQSVDVAGQGEIYALIERIRDHLGCGVLVVSHDLHLVMQAADAVYCLNHHICCTGRPDAVSRNPEYLRLFGRAQSPRLGIYTHEHDHRHDASGEVLTPASRQVRADD